LNEKKAGTLLKPSVEPYIRDSIPEKDSQPCGGRKGTVGGAEMLEDLLVGSLRTGCIQ